MFYDFQLRYRHQRLRLPHLVYEVENDVLGNYLQIRNASRFQSA